MFLLPSLRARTPFRRASVPAAAMSAAAGAPYALLPPPQDPHCSIDADGNIRVANLEQIAVVLLGVWPRQDHAAMQRLAVRLFERTNPLLWQAAQPLKSAIQVFCYTTHDASVRHSTVRLIDFVSGHAPLPPHASIVIQQDSHPRRQGPALDYVIATILRGGNHILRSGQKTLCPIL
jgi:hypothetical protein